MLIAGFYLYYNRMDGKIMKIEITKRKVTKLLCEFFLCGCIVVASTALANTTEEGKIGFMFLGVLAMVGIEKL